MENKLSIPETFRSENGQLYKTEIDKKEETNEDGNLVRKIYVKYIPIEKKQVKETLTNNLNNQVRDLPPPQPKIEQITPMRYSERNHQNLARDLRENEEDPSFKDPSSLYINPNNKIGEFNENPEEIQNLNLSYQTNFFEFSEIQEEEKPKPKNIQESNFFFDDYKSQDHQQEFIKSKRTIDRLFQKDSRNNQKPVQEVNTHESHFKKHFLQLTQNKDNRMVYKENDLFRFN